MLKQAPGRRGNRPRSGLNKVQNELLLARHAVFRRSADHRRGSLKIGILRISSDLLSRRNNYSPIKLKKVSARALFSVSGVVQSGTRRRICALRKRRRDDSFYTIIIIGGESKCLMYLSSLGFY
jgi:hypothetical protein